MFFRYFLNLVDKKKKLLVVTKKVISLCSKSIKGMKNNNIKVGDFVKAMFNGSPVRGVVTDIKKGVIVIEKYQGTGHWDVTTGYTTYTGTNTFLNIRKIDSIEKINLAVQK